MARPAPAGIPEIYAQQPQQGFDPFGDLMVLRDIQPDLSGMDFIDPSGIDIGAIDIPDAVTVADILNLPKVLTDEEKFQKAEEELAAAAKRLADFQAMKGSAYGLGTTEEGDQADQYFTRQAELQAELEQARNTYVALGGDLDPSLLSKLGQGALDLIGGAGQAFSDIVTLGTGPEVAQTLLDPVSILLGGLGGTINYAESGKTTPLIVGKTTKTGMPVGLNIPDPRAVLEGGLTTLIPGAAAAATTAGALSVSGNEQGQDPTSGVGPTAAGVLTAAAADDDDDDDAAGAIKTTDQVTVDPNKVPVTVDPNAGDPIGPVLVAASDQLPPVDRVSLPEAQVPVDRVSLPEAQVPVGRVSLPEAQVAVERTSLPEAVIEEILANERTDPTRTSLPEPTKTSVAAAGGGGGGGGGTTAPSGGIRTVSGGPGPSVDIDYLYDFAKGLEQPFQATEEEEEDIVRAAEGGMIGNTDDFERILRILRGM